MYYFAYGSNLHPLRLQERVSSARLVASACFEKARLRFNKLGLDGSGKCNLHISDSVDDKVFGAVYEIADSHKSELDKFESLGQGYIDKQIEVRIKQECLSCFTYFAQDSHIDEALNPYDWYKQLVLAGARYLDFPSEYLETIEQIEAICDSDFMRRQKHETLLLKMLNYSLPGQS